MEIMATILDAKKAKGGTQILMVKLDKEKTKVQCTVKEGENYTCQGSCEGCGGCTLGSKPGLLAVSGDMVNAINRTQAQLKKGDLVLIEVSKKVQIYEFLLSIVLPIILAIFGFKGFWQLFRTELYGIIGVFVGITLGVLIAFFSKKLNGTKYLPEVKSVVGSRLEKTTNIL